MDTLSHALWGMGLFGYRRYKWQAFLAGALPDLLVFGVLFLVRLVEGGVSFGKPDLATIPGWTFAVYDVTHSWVVSGLVIAMVWRLNREIGFMLLAWPMHILLDIPFHSADYFPTKFLWPLSNFHVDGIPWASPFIWFPNLAGLAILFSYRRKNRKKVSLDRTVS